jgi:uncharacterized membrane protein
MWRRLLGQRWVVLAALLLGCIVLTAMVPPTQAPDERPHLMRAYMVAHGQLTLERGPDGSGGGEVDTGLEEFCAAWGSMRRAPSVRVSDAMVSAASEASWTGERMFFKITSALAAYAPMVYAPLAAGLGLGELAGLSVWHSYLLARGMMIAVTFATLGVAFAIVRPTPLVIASIALPMSIFQLASPVIDGFCMALCALVASVFLRVMADGKRAPGWAMLVMAVASVVVVTSRFNMLPLIGLVALGSACTRRRGDIVWAALSAGAVVGWAAYVVSARPARSATAAAAGATVPLEAYVPGLTAVWGKLMQTLGSPDWLLTQYRMYIGNLGSLDTPLASSAYPVIGALLGLAALVSMRWGVIRTQRLASIALCTCGVLSAVLVLLVLAIYFTQGNAANPIRGVQGRYFLIPVMMIAYATATARTCVAPESRARWWVGSAVSWLTIVVSIAYAVSALADRYYGPGA